MGNFYLDNEDLRFYVDRGLDWAPLIELMEEGHQAPGGFATTEEALEFYKETLVMLGQFVSDEIASVVKKLDDDPPRLQNGDVVQSAALEEIMAKIKGLEIHGMGLPRELGGMNLPLLVCMLGGEIFARADVSVMAHHGFHGGMAIAMLMYSVLEGSTVFDKEKRQIVKTRFEDQIREIIRGDAWGSMDITEPNAGSDMGALRTKAELGPDGRWYLSGQKIFITSGHGKYHFVIARSEPDSAEGLDGLSLFLVPAYEDGPNGRKRHATVDRLEEKLGHHSSATCAITFDRSPAELIGKRGEGFKLMLLLMNGARLSVGFEALGLCEAAYRLAKEYAAERTAFGKPIERHEMIADYLEEMRTDVQAIRALAMYGGFHEELAQRLQRALLLASDPGSVDAERTRRRMKEHQAKSRRVTPLIKYIASEKAVELARRAIQIHGGSGYMKEYGAEKLLRDAIVMPIYEGTSQIQALMAMKDTMSGILKHPQEFVTRAAQARWRSLSARDPFERRVAKLQVLSHGAIQHLMSRTATDKLRAVSNQPITEWARALRSKWDPKRDFAHAMLHAERLTKLLTDVAIAEVLLEQAEKHPDRRELLERHLERAEPRCRFLHDEITTTGDRLIGMLNPVEPGHRSAVDQV
jgi:3-(methylthio)propanoyl-CoA dehydrogenase